MNTNEAPRVEQIITVHSFGLSDAAQRALFERVADAAHALDENVTCST